MSEANSESAIWQVWVETGGTFTDCIARDPAGNLHRAKALSSSALRGTIIESVSAAKIRVRESWLAPADFIRGMPLSLLGDGAVASAVRSFAPDTGLVELETPLSRDRLDGTAFEVRFPYEAPILAARLVTARPPGESLPPMSLRVATTRGTNALLTRRGTPPALFITNGFGDALEIGTQQRKDLFALDIVKPAPLHAISVEVPERLAADGSIIQPLDEDFVRVEAARLVALGIRTAAVALLHSYLNPAHEQRLSEILRDAGFTHASVSSSLAPFVKHLPRAQTAVVNAYLAPILDAYLSGIESEIPPHESRTTFHVMTSAGGLVRHDAFQPKDSLLSGPAGGVVGALHAARAVGWDRIIAFDMGGTSTDVARCDGGFDYTFEHQIGDANLVAPALAIESVAAGGGSICYADRQGIHVGPQSAGAEPGPACYGAGGPLTITDVNLLLGRLQPERFEIPLNIAAAERAADTLLADLARHSRDPNRPTVPQPDRQSVLQGLLDIANERMADAIRRISLRRGYDPADYALVAFGGAGDQHACAVARLLGMRTIILPPDASLLSARGLAQAAIERFAEQQILQPLDADLVDSLPEIVRRLERKSIGEVANEGVAPESITIRRRIATLRLTGQEAGIEIEIAPESPLDRDFARRYEAIYGYQPAAGRTVELVAVRVVAAASTAEASFETRAIDVSSINVDAGWRATAHASGAIILQAVDDDAPPGKMLETHNSRAEQSIQEALFEGRFTALAEEMGESLRRTALSTNVKERLDFSCALLDPDGHLVANAAHIPVHIGALGECVRRVALAIEIGPGDVIITNHPAFGGSHLPDVTVITAVFDAKDTLLGYVASRAHHAEIGGTRPGSMPPNATTLAEEGVVLAPTYLMRKGVSRLDDVCGILTTAPYPTRAPADNRSDIEAALAANRRGADILMQLARDHGATTVWRYMAEVQARSERLLRAVLSHLDGNIYAATEHLDDGSAITIRIVIHGDEAEIDFAGTAATHPGNLNATPAIAMSAVLYILRLLVQESVPLNEGLMRPVTLILPEDTLVNPRFDLDDPPRCPAVVGGNTETSQRIVDTLIRALGLAACSQGTMNNTLWGNDAFGYYETVCGGAGATANAPGASAVHTHMTNTRITDVEIVERRYPVRIERFAIRHGSGGDGRHPGGNGIVRETIFLAPMSLSVLTQHRASGPYGIAGGEAGQPGRQRVVRVSGDVVELGSVDGCDVNPGDRLVLETPGGGGWGQP